MRNPTFLGDILLVVFPKTVKRLILLSDLRDQSHKHRAKWNMFTNVRNDRLKYKMIADYYMIAKEFHDNKYFWMSDLKIITK